jgi:hypothetical protein
MADSGGWEDDPHPHSLRTVTFVAILSALEAIADGSYQGRGVDPYQALPANGRRIGDLVILGATLVIPDLPPFRADLLVDYGKPLLEEEGTIAEIGDLAEVEARDTLFLEGMYIHPDETALDRGPAGVQIQVGAPANFSVSQRSDGRDILWTFRGRLPNDVRRRR